MASMDTTSTHPPASADSNTPSSRPSRPAPEPRAAFKVFEAVGTRWGDNDVYGHVNNVVYYAMFDTAVNRYLIEAAALDIHAGEVIGLVVETHCNYFAPIEFPQTIDIGIRVGHRGSSSVRYEIGVFAAGAPMSAACGHFIHVYVDRATRRPATLPDALKAALDRLS
ncbi:MAG: 1,4-dihydroxy-2-naphthoyl-CoA hydrolase [Rhizobacter sp.]|nr:1,4-dihydroxy-2-naphthoyl-CoA hydrolase [Rhizobacter sp.]